MINPHHSFTRYFLFCSPRFFAFTSTFIINCIIYCLKIKISLIYFAIATSLCSFFVIKKVGPPQFHIRGGFWCGTERVLVLNWGVFVVELRDFGCWKGVVLVGNRCVELRGTPFRINWRIRNEIKDDPDWKFPNFLQLNFQAFWK